jgi:hypothetical protein
MSQTVDLPNGDTIEFPDSMSQDQIDAAVRQHLAQSDSGAASGPSLSERFGIRPATTEEGIVARSGIRALPPVAAANALVGGANALSWLGQKYLGLAPDQPLLDTNGQPIGDGRISMPSEAIIHSLDLEPKQPLTPGQQTTESVLPWLMPNSNMISRWREAPGLINKAYAVGKSELGAGIDWLASTAGQEYAREHGWGPVAETIAGMVGANVRPATSAVVNAVAPHVAGQGPEGGRKFDVNVKSGSLPPAGVVGGPTVQSLETGARSVPFTKSTIESAYRAQKDAIAETADRGIDQFAPGATSVTEAHPGTANEAARNLGEDARSMMRFGEGTLKDWQDHLDAQIGPGRRIPIQPILDAADQIINNRDNSLAVRSAAAKLRETIAANDTANTGFITYNALKQERTNVDTTLAGLFPDLQGKPSMHPTIGTVAVEPIKTAMTNALGQAADQAGVGREWRDADASWGENARMQENLYPFGGKLQRGDIQGPTANEPSVSAVKGKLEDAVEGKQSTIDTLNQELGPTVTNSAIAETLAAKGRPTGGGRTTEFRPDVWGQRVQNETGSPLMDYIERQAGPGARADIENSAAAGRTIGPPREAGGLAATLGAVAQAGGKFMSPLSHVFLEDPAVIRSLAGRSWERERIPPLLEQYAQRSGLGAIEQPPAVQKAVSGMVHTAPAVAGNVWNSVASTLSRLVGGVAK